MFRMREGLKLARALGVPIAKSFVFHGRTENAGEKLRLGEKTFRRQPGGFAGFLNRGEIDVRGQILFAGIGQQVVAAVMTLIRAQRPAFTSG